VKCRISKKISQASRK